MVELDCSLIEGVFARSANTIIFKLLPFELMEALKFFITFHDGKSLETNEGETAVLVAGVGTGTGIPTGSQSRDRFLDPGLGPGSTSENRDGIDFRPGSRFFFIKTRLFFGLLNNF